MIILSSLSPWLCHGLLSHPEDAGLVPGRDAAETPMPALLLGWPQRECFLMSPEIRSCCLMFWRRPGHQQPSCSHSSACASVLRCVLIPRERQHRAFFWPEGRCDHGLLGWVWRKTDICKHLNCRGAWGGCLPFCSPMAAKKICKEMQGKQLLSQGSCLPNPVSSAALLATVSGIVSR